MAVTYTNQIQILHLSDLHFGEHHICNPVESASRKGIPTLAELIGDDLQTDFGATVYDVTDYVDHPKPPLIVAVSGDFTQKAKSDEFKEAESFLNALISKPIMHRTVHKKNVYIIPGNHDVSYESHSPDERFQSYTNFYNRFYGNQRPTAAAHEPMDFTQVHADDIDGNKFLIAEINCSIYVEKGTEDSSRGQVDMDSIKRLRQKLNELSQNTDYEDYIKVAMMHHHVVLLPAFIESGRGVDSIVNAGYLLELLSENNFHLILHGHKHYPQIFNYEPLPLWSESSTKIPQLVISGGSCGSRELPDTVDTACNTYSVITIKWHPAANQARVQVITRGLIRKGKKLLAPDEWKWRTVNISDKILSPYQTVPPVGEFRLEEIGDDKGRLEKYEMQRGMMPVVEVMPSLIPNQAYEVRAWIVSHRPESQKTPKLSIVEWTAGRKFRKIICERKTNPDFCMAYQYWGPMLMEAKMIFEDGYTISSFVYARMPRNETKGPI
ncbi:metallophosphoesterase family protein [Pedobacter caeni]|uniref:3',5'-cyclic AMP phosphodiesterase CpdA n=1 Tax=Pedobacter caeni TaxID=288992 RepID=A0A1M4VBU8_9SPHI|nr:metallophosphoesterase [Pedobacter caeni]SHE66411.1 3',5'-cyclic AMP phosphodiesterase CpdA [Pedobacter caeni]